MIHPSIHSSISIYFRLFPFLANPHRSFPLRRLLTLCVSFNTLTINTSFPSSPVSSTVNHVIKLLLTFSSILPFILASPIIPDYSRSLPIPTSRFRLITSKLNIFLSMPYLSPPLKLLSPLPLAIKSLLIFSSILPPSFLFS